MRNTKATMCNRHRPTADELGRPLGRRHPTYFEWFPKHKPLKETGEGKLVYDEYGYPDYKKREYRYIDGARGKLVPLSYGKGRRRDEGPRGGRGWQYFHYRLYVVELDGVPTLCRYRHERVDYDPDNGFTYHDYWEPYSGAVFGIDGYEAHMVLSYGIASEENAA